MITLLAVVLALLQVPGQTPVGIFSSASCGSPVLINSGSIKTFWYSADCMTATSPCATSYTDGHSFTTGQTWLDRSTNANTLTIDSNELSCVFKLNKISGKPALGFNVDGGGNCGWTFASQPDASATSWAVFIVFQNTSGSAAQTTLLGPNTNATGVGTFYYGTGRAGSPDPQQDLDKQNIVQVGNGTATQDTNWHLASVQFSNSSDQNSIAFRLDRAADGSTLLTSTNINTTNGGIAELGVIKTGGVYSQALVGRVTEFILYTGTGVLLTAGNVTTNETYFNCRYPGLPHS